MPLSRVSAGKSFQLPKKTYRIRPADLEAAFPGAFLKVGTAARTSCPSVRHRRTPLELSTSPPLYFFPPYFGYSWHSEFPHDECATILALFGVAPRKIFEFHVNNFRVHASARSDGKVHSAVVKPEIPIRREGVKAGKVMTLADGDALLVVLLGLKVGQGGSTQSVWHHLVGLVYNPCRRLA